MRIASVALSLIISLSTFKSLADSSQATVKKPTGSVNYVSIVTSGITLHGLPNQGVAGQYMPRAIDRGGQLVITPGIGFFLQHNSWLYEAAFLKDCYNHDAIPLLIGRQWKFNRIPHLKLGLLGGVYIRQNPDFCSGDDCIEFKDFGPLPRLLVADDKWQIFPYATVQFDYMIPLSRVVDAEISFSSMIIVNQLTVGLRFRLP